METAPARAVVLPSLDRVRAGLEAPSRPRTPMWLLLLVALFAAVMGVTVAGVMILGPGGGVPTSHTVQLN